MGNYSLDKTDKDGNITGSIALEVRVHPIAEPKGKTKAYASVSIDGMFGVHGISVIEGKNGLFASMPQTKDAQGGYRDIFHPVTSEGRKALNNAVLAEFAAVMENQEPKKESAIAQIREGEKAAKDQPTPDKTKAKAAAKTGKTKSDDTR